MIGGDRFGGFPGRGEVCLAPPMILVKAGANDHFSGCRPKFFSGRFPENVLCYFPPKLNEGTMDMDRLVIRVQRIAEAGPGVRLPAKQTPGAAGYDVCAANSEPIVLQPGERAAAPTGLRLSIPPGFEVQVRPRSGLALKHGIILPNSPGTIDSDYRGELKVILMNLGQAPFVVNPGDRIAQLVVSRFVEADFQEVPALDDTERGSGGFGHTGV